MFLHVLHFAMVVFYESKFRKDLRGNAKTLTKLEEQEVICKDSGAPH